VTEIRLHALSREIRKTAEELAQNLQILRAVTEGTSDAVFVKDRDGRYLMINTAGAQFLGRTVPEVVGRHDTELFSPETVHYVLEGDAEVRRLGEVHTFEESITAAGINRTYLATKGPVRTTDGEVVGTFGISRDITGRKAMEERLRQSEAHFRSLFLNAGVGMVMFSPDGSILDCNPALTRMLGYPPDALEARSVLTLWDAEDRRDGEALLRQMLQGERPGFELEARLVRDDGERVWTHVSASLVRAPSGEPLHGIKVVQDVSAERAAETALREQKELLQTVFDQIPALIAVFDAQDRVRLVNRQWEQVLGWGAAEADLLALLFPDPALQDRAREVRRTGCGTWTELPTRLADGRTLQVQWSSVPLSDGGSVCIGMDITERHELELQLRQSQKLEAVGRLAGGVAHDFNNMLAVINGYSDLLLLQREVLPGAHVQGPLQEIRKAGERAAALTKQLLALSRKQLLAPRVLDVNALIQDLDKMLRRLIGEDIELVTLLGPEAGAVRADPGQLEQALLNLAVNARDAMPHGGRLLLETGCERLDGQASVFHPDLVPGNYVTIQVADTGCGMSEATLSHIFEPFFTTKPAGQGTGLGLATVFGIVKQSGGHITVESRVDAGTRFRIYLPQAGDPADAEPGPSRSALPRGQGTILLCEDEPMVREMVRTILETSGYRVLGSLDPVEALQIAREHPGRIDLLLTDVVMPQMSGRQLAEKLLAQQPDLKVVFMSGYTDDAVLRHGIRDDEVAFLAKPFTPLDLIQAISAQLAARAVPVGCRGKVLLVDDAPDLRESLTDLLMDEQYEVRTAADGLQALELLRSGYRPNVILLDLMMPRMNGWVFRMEQQRDPALADIPVIVLAAEHDPDLARGYLQAVASFTKPLEIGRLLDHLARICRLRP
jgi:PAS domain S-box-containing protein